MLINLRNALMSGKRTPTAKDYVQDGLIAMWDGIENAGWGTHDASATVWKDLIGNLDLQSNRSVTWGDMFFNGGGNRYFHLATDTIGNIIQSGKYTVEICCGASRGATNGGILAIGGTVGTAPNRQFWFWERNSNQYESYIDACDTCQGNYSIFRTLTTFGNIYTFGVAVTNGNRTAYLDGNSVYSTTGSTSSRTGGHIYVGYLPSYSFSLSNVYSIRVYDRALDAQEISANRSIDRVRFGETIS